MKTPSPERPPHEHHAGDKLGASRSTSNPTQRLSHTVFVLAASALATLCLPTPTYAVDGCRAMLCLAAPSWRDVPLCVPTIRELMHDLARGKPFPVCQMAGAGNQASVQGTRAPANCPPQYTHVWTTQGGPRYRCDYSGVVSVNVNGALWSRTWWNLGGDSVTEFTPTAKTGLSNWNTQFDDDYAAWLANPPADALTSSASE